MLADVMRRFPNIRLKGNDDDGGIDEEEFNKAQKLLHRATEPLLVEAKLEDNASLFSKLKEIANDLAALRRGTIYVLMSS